MWADTDLLFARYKMILSAYATIAAADNVPYIEHRHYFLKALFRGSHRFIPLSECFIHFIIIRAEAGYVYCPGDNCYYIKNGGA